MNSAQIGLMILCVVAFCMVIICEITIYLVRKFFNFLDNKKKYKKRIVELEGELKKQTDKAHEEALMFDEFVE